MAIAACSEHAKVAATLSMSLCAISKHQTPNTTATRSKPTAQLRSLPEIYAKTIKNKSSSQWLMTAATTRTTTRTTTTTGTTTTTAMQFPCERALTACAPGKMVAGEAGQPIGARLRCGLCERREITLE